MPPQPYRTSIFLILRLLGLIDFFPILLAVEIRHICCLSSKIRWWAKRVGSDTIASSNRIAQGNNGDFVTDYEAKEAIQAVFRGLKNHVSEGEVHDIIAVPPGEIKSALAMA